MLMSSSDLENELPDLSDPELYRADPVPLWALLRARTPVFYTPVSDRGAFWSVLGHEPATRVLTDPSTFVSGKGMRLGNEQPATEAAAGKMLIITDPPRHGMIKRIISSTYTPRTVARLRDTMREVVTEALDVAYEQDVCDFTDVAARLPVAVICDMLGVPKSDWDLMLRLTATALGNDPHTSVEQMREAYTDLFLYYDDLAKHRRRNPGSDVTSALVNGQIDGEPLTDEEVFLNCTGLLSGGNETTRYGTVGGLLALIDNPDSWRTLQADRSHVPSAVQEILRYASPLLHVRRTAVRDAEIGGHAISSGDQLAVWLPAVNRDPKAFVDPETFDITRSPNRHFAFGHGPHFCIGAPLAATEMEVFFEELVRRTDHAELAGQPQRLISDLVWGFETMPVRLVPR
ncbi:cytochrome P450 [Micromonospora sp. NBC_01405]|uniref:cytochrome P450 n=1 Tax=Micromonospora sp. NBC_01405 TaxID=2903589 RepID=UPI00324BF550